jgi:hypothetical protein
MGIPRLRPAEGLAVNAVQNRFVQTRQPVVLFPCEVNAYLFSAGVTYSRITRDLGAVTEQGGFAMVNRVRTWDRCLDLVVGSGTPEEAQNQFQAWLAGGQDDSTELEVKKIVHL